MSGKEGYAGSKRLDRSSSTLSWKIVDNKISCKVHKGEVVRFLRIAGQDVPNLQCLYLVRAMELNISGELLSRGEKVNLKNPHDAIRHGSCICNQKTVRQTD